MDSKIQKFLEMLNSSDNVVFFGGAGVSTESGIPDFRSQDGLYNMKYDYPPETILSHTFFTRMTKEFYKFYRDKILCVDAKPNIIHTTLARLEESGKLKAVVTQNIDGLHFEGGSKKVYELHGSVYRNYCIECGEFYDVNFMRENTEEIPHCTKCGGVIKPDVVLYEEPLDETIIMGAVEAISKANMMIVGGTSLSVYPAAGFLRYFHGDKLVIINKSATLMDSEASLVIHSSLGEVFKEVKC